MAKPIRKTPALSGKQAQEFIEKMLKTGKRSINSMEKQIVELISSM